MSRPASSSLSSTWHIFWDLQCPYARKHWHQHRTVLANAFRHQFDFEIHLTSLAFHPHAFPGQCAAQLLEQEKGHDAKLRFIDACFEHQHEYTNVALPDPTKSDIKRVFATIAQRAGLLDSEEVEDTIMDGANQLTLNDFMVRMDDWEKVVKPAYSEHKIALSYGVFGTPKHVIHGKLVPDTESSWGVDEWKVKLDSL